MSNGRIRAFLVIHGIVQGVGYRHLVSRSAERHGIKGMVRNTKDGSVEVLAEGALKDIEAFEKEIDVSIPHGPQVFKIERYEEGNAQFPRGLRYYTEFKVEKMEES